MNLKYKIATLLITCFLSSYLYAQPGRPTIKQPPKINSVLKATTNASVKAKIHANSNSVFGPGNNHTSKKKQVNKSEVKNEAEVKKTKKTKKEKKQ